MNQTKELIKLEIIPWIFKLFFLQVRSLSLSRSWQEWEHTGRWQLSAAGYFTILGHSLTTYFLVVQSIHAVFSFLIVQSRHAEAVINEFITFPRNSNLGMRYEVKLQSCAQLYFCTRLNYRTFTILKFLFHPH